MTIEQQLVAALKDNDELSANLEQATDALQNMFIAHEHKTNECDRLSAENTKLRDALEKLRDCDWVITLPDRMDAVRVIARDALKP